MARPGGQRGLGSRVLSLRWKVSSAVRTESPESQTLNRKSQSPMREMSRLLQTYEVFQNAGSPFSATAKGSM